MENLRSQDLRIGNYVMFSNNSEIFKVTGISEFGLDVENEVEEIYMEYDNFEPIPLTEEWLLKFGFEITNNEGDKKDFEYKTFYPFYLSLDHDEVCLNYDTKSGYYCIFYDDKRLLFIHQLQNLYFALTGEEL